MSIEEAYHLIQRQQPPILYFSGKTSTGKSTFAQKLQNDLGYEVIQLDQLVRQAVIEPLALKDEGQVFVEVYKHRTNLDWVERFLTAAQQAISQALRGGHRLILEGALANPQTLKQVLEAAPQSQFFYFHPSNLKTYERNLTSRFLETSETNKAGLPDHFWQLVDQQAFKQFCRDRQLTPALAQAIRTYAQGSQSESKARLAAFHDQFDNILVIEV